MIFKYLLLLISYLIGSIPFSVILGKKLKGIDVRDHGSGNPGGTNSLRLLGKKVGFLVVAGDVSKGGIIVLLMVLGVFDNYDLFHPLAYGVAAVIGHVFSIFIKFKGGKAVGTTVGMISPFNPLISVSLAIVFLITLKLSKYVSISSTMYAIGLVISALIIQDYEMLIYVSFLALLIFYRHISNYKNLVNKVEPKVTWI